MDEPEYERMARAEQRSWWFRGRRRVVEGMVASLGLPSDAHIVDVGCGTGGNLPMLARYGEAVGVEEAPEAVRFARRQAGVSVHRGSAGSLPLGDASVDLVTLLDVLEHLDDDVGAVSEIARVLAPGGRLLLTVPAWPFLWSGHDDALHHRRRYRRPELRRVLRAGGLSPERLAYYNVALFPPVAAVRLGRRLVGGGDRQADTADELPTPLARTLEALFAAERHVLPRASPPFGVSLLAVARRPG